MKHSTKKLALLALLSTTSFMITFGAAHAKRCDYIAHDGSGKYITYGTGYAFKQHNACDRARRTCNRRLNRATRQGKVGRGAKCVVLREVGS